MIKAYRNYWLNYFNFSNRTSRRDYWLVILMTFIVNVLLSYIIVKTFGYNINISSIKTYEELEMIAKTTVGKINLIWVALNFIPGLSINVRRMHDINKSGAMILINIIPIIGSLIYFIFLLRGSIDSGNNYGRQV